MTIDIQIPEFPESISEGTIGAWVKKAGDKVAEGETIVEVETDKVVLEIPAPASGVIEQVIKNENDTVNSLEVIGHISEQAAASQEDFADQAPPVVAKNVEADVNVNDDSSVESGYKKTSPAVRKLIQEKQVDLEAVTPTGKNNRVTKDDVLRSKQQSSTTTMSASTDTSGKVTFANEIQRVPMSSLRKKISQRLVNAQQEYAMLTTFNEVNMQKIIDIRSSNKEEFFDKHGVKLGFMSFFALAAVEALKAFPIINASIENNDIIYYQYVNIGVAVSTERGLVVPVVRGADEKSLSSIEVEINQLAEKARENNLSIDDLVDGTFTITNGGVFGSMLSTPIINPPQSAILGMHSIEKRPIVVDDEVVVAPMMYLALSYDHRIIDGREAVLFLSQIKKIIENPIQLLLHL